jgi:hypothetical protein
MDIEPGTRAYAHAMGALCMSRTASLYCDMANAARDVGNLEAAAQWIEQAKGAVAVAEYMRTLAECGWRLCPPALA